MPTVCPSCGATNLEGADECRDCGTDLHQVDLPAPASAAEQAVMQLPLTALEMTKVHAISPDTPLEVAVFTLRRQKLDLLEIVEDNNLVGVISVRDLLTRVGPDYASKLKLPVSQFMTPRPETLPPEAPITYVVNRMDVGGFRHVPVVQEGRILGVISARSVIRYLVRSAR